MVTERSKANLIKNSDLTPQERKEKASKMGKASVKSRREKKAIREWVLTFMHDAMTDDMCDKYELPHGTTYAAAMALKGMKGFLDGNPAMARLILELIGETKQELNITGAIPVFIRDDVNE